MIRSRTVREALGLDHFADADNIISVRPHVRKHPSKPLKWRETHRALGLGSFRPSASIPTERGAGGVG